MNMLISTYNFFLLIFGLEPINSAAIKTMANKKPARPSFHDFLIDTGSAIIMKIIGVIRSRIAGITEFILKMTKWVFVLEV
jgi:hypothetical protein